MRRRGLASLRMPPGNHSAGPHRPVACFATQGQGSLDELRIRSLLADFDPEILAFDRSAKTRSMLRLVSILWQRRPAVVVMEGTGVAGGLALIVLPKRLGIRYVVSSGDAVGPYLAKRNRALGLVGGLYERVLIRRSCGYIGWTPYLVGRALTFGAPRAMSAPGWARSGPTPGDRNRRREELGIAKDAVVFGLVGSLSWNRSVRYVYGLELIRALRRTSRQDICVCVVGDGSGRARLVQEAGDELGRRVLLPGRVGPEDVADTLSAFDVASLPQSTDGVGSFRYTSKLPEYLAAGLPIVTGEIPLAYDLDEGWIWRLRGDAPWEDAYVGALADLMEGLTREDLALRTAAAQSVVRAFDAQEQRRRVGAFISDLMARAPSVSAR